MKPQDFTTLAQFLERRSGLHVTEEQRYWLEAKLHPLLAQHHLADWTQLTHALNDNTALADQVVEAMTVNETSFMRDRKPFETFRHVILPQLPQMPRLWSCGCATGQEAYSLAMILAEENRNGDIFASDLSRDALSRAREGRYSQFEVQRGLPTPFLLKYFTQSENEHWRIGDTLRQRITFCHDNLLHGQAHGTFNAIFCRNVLFYMQGATRQRIIDHLIASLNPGGFLILGGTETGLEKSSRLSPLDGTHNIYRKS